MSWSNGVSDQTICARCTRRLGSATGESAIYNPGRDHGIELCEPCFFAEDAEITERGMNDLPDTLAKYRENLRRFGR